MKQIALKSTQQIVYLFQTLKGLVGNDIKNVQLVCDAMSYCAKSGIKWQSVFLDMSSQSFARDCNTIAADSSADVFPQIIHLQLQDEAEANYQQILTEIRDSGVTSRPRNIAIIKAALYAYLQSFPVTRREASVTSTDSYDVEFNALSLDEKLYLIHAELQFLTANLNKLLSIVNPK